MATVAAIAAGGVGALSRTLHRSAAQSQGYGEVARWQVPGGEGRIIALDRALSVPDLRELGDRLQEESRRLDVGVVMVFDNVEAARDVRRGSRLIGERRFEAALLHQRAMYLKETALGVHQLVMYTRYPEVLEVVRF